MKGPCGKRASTNALARLRHHHHPRAQRFPGVIAIHSRSLMDAASSRLTGPTIARPVRLRNKLDASNAGGALTLP